VGAPAQVVRLPCLYVELALILPTVLIVMRVMSTIVAVAQLAQPALTPPKDCIAVMALARLLAYLVRRPGQSLVTTLFVSNGLWMPSGQLFGPPAVHNPAAYAQNMMPFYLQAVSSPKWLLLISGLDRIGLTSKASSSSFLPSHK